MMIGQDCQYSAMSWFNYAQPITTDGLNKKGNKIGMMWRTCGGLTLLELVVVVVIIGVLVNFAYPTYQENVRSDKTALAKAFLLEISNRQQHYLGRHGNYAPNLAQLGAVPSQALSSHYSIVIDIDREASIANFSAQALPIWPGSDSTTDIFSLNHLGQTSDNWHD